MDIVENFVKNLASEIKEEFQNKYQLKIDIQTEIKSRDNKSTSKETAFCHLLWERVFKSKPKWKVNMEGIHTTESKNKFNDRFYCPDFYIKTPLAVVGEIKYGKLSLRSLGQAIGQAYAYMSVPNYKTSHEQEPIQFKCGLVIYCSPEPVKEDDQIKDIIKKTKELSVYIIIV